MNPSPKESRTIPLRLACIHNLRLPTEKANGVQISKMCEAFVRAGVAVSLVLPMRENPIKADFFEYYRLRERFPITYLPSPDLLTRFARWPRFAFFAQAIGFLKVLRAHTLSQDTVILTRNPEIAWWYAYKGYEVFFDGHNFPTRQAWLWKFLLSRVKGVIANSQGTASAFKAVGIGPVFAAPNAVDLIQFLEDGQGSLEGISLPSGKIAMYLGHLYGWKGVDTVVAAAERSQNPELVFVLVGGTEEDVARYRTKTAGMKNIFFLGHKGRKEVPTLMKRAQVLLLPNVPTTKESVAYTSPIKMFEYMASRVPIVASDLPSIREVLSEKNAVLVSAGDPDALLRGIDQGLTGIGQERAKVAWNDVQEYTWEKRAEQILSFMSNYVRNYR